VIKVTKVSHITKMLFQQKNKLFIEISYFKHHLNKNAFYENMLHLNPLLDSLPNQGPTPI